MNKKKPFKSFGCLAIFIAGLYPLASMAQCDNSSYAVYLDNQSPGKLVMKMAHVDNGSFSIANSPPPILDPTTDGNYPVLTFSNLTGDGSCASATLTYGADNTLGNIPTCKFTVTSTGAHNAYSVSATAISNPANTICTVGKVNNAIDWPLLIIQSK